MTASSVTQQFKFCLGDDVVARLCAGPPFDLEEGAPVSPAERLSWAVATIAGREWLNDAPHYLLSFRIEEERYLCIEAESSIEGFA